MIYYISDLHLYDEKIMKLCSRPFKNGDDYFNTLKSKWNEKVKNTDTIYILGDLFSMNGKVSQKHLLKLNELNGKKHLIIGNHDECLINKLSKSNIFVSISHVKVIKDKNRIVCLCHYPMMDWYDFNYDSYHIYGHIHNKTYKNGECYNEIKNYFRNKKAYNASVDVIDFIPQTLDQLIRLKNERKNNETIN